MSTTKSDPSNPPTHSASISMPTSAFLLSRLETIRTSILENFQYIIEASQSGSKIMQISRDPANGRVYDESVEVDDSKQPSLAQTKMDQVRMDVEVEALIKNCEDLLGLSRVLKEGWVFGGLDTVKKKDEKVAEGDAREWQEAREGMDEWLTRYFEKYSEKTADQGLKAGNAG